MKTAGYFINAYNLRPEWKDDLVFVSSAGDVAPLDAPTFISAGGTYKGKFLDGSEHPLPEGVLR